jgi:hypothetical protein
MLSVMGPYSAFPGLGEFMKEVLSDTPTSLLQVTTVSKGLQGLTHCPRRSCRGSVLRFRH